MIQCHHHHHFTAYCNQILTGNLNSIQKQLVNVIIMLFYSPKESKYKAADTVHLSICGWLLLVSVKVVLDVPWEVVWEDEPFRRCCAMWSWWRGSDLPCQRLCDQTKDLFRWPWNNRRRVPIWSRLVPSPEVNQFCYNEITKKLDHFYHRMWMWRNR